MFYYFQKSEITVYRMNALCVLGTLYMLSNLIYMNSCKVVINISVLKIRKPLFQGVNLPKVTELVRGEIGICF